MDGPAGLLERLGPCLDVGNVEGANAVELEVVHAPGGELVGPGIDEVLRAGLAVIDADHAAAVVVVLPHRRLRDLVGGVAGGLAVRAEDRRVLRHGLHGPDGHGGDPQGPYLAVALRDVHAP